MRCHVIDQLEAMLAAINEPAPKVTNLYGQGDLNAWQARIAEAKDQAVTHLPALLVCAIAAKILLDNLWWVVDDKEIAPEREALCSAFEMLELGR